MEPVTVKKVKRNHASNRLILTKKAQEKASLWLSQIDDKFNGMLSLKRNDLINTILEELDESLSVGLLEKIRSEKLTDIEKAKWIYEKILTAQKEGLETSLDELIKTAQDGPKRRRKALKTSVKKSQTLLSESAKISPNNTKKAFNSI